MDENAFPQGHLVLLALRLLVGGQFLVFGIDGIFQILPRPRQSPEMKRFVEVVIETKFILPTVKVIECLAGVLLILDGGSVGALLALLPIVYGIVCSQVIFNQKNGYGITLFILIPYLLLLGLYGKSILALV